MRVTVIGAGVTGLAASWYLLKDGHEVTVIDRNDDVGLDASFANGGQLSYSYVAPLAGPDVLAKIPAWLTRADSPVHFRPKLDLLQWRWLMNFVGACSRRQSEASTRSLLNLAFLSRGLMYDLIAAEPTIRFDYANSGKLVVHRSAASLEGAQRLMSYQRTLGCEQEAIDPQACVAVEPALAHLADQLAGGILTRSEASGDCHQFCTSISRVLRERGVIFRLGTRVTRLTAGVGRVIHAYAGEHRLESDHVVIASGTPSVELLRPLGVRLPLYPLKGYSLTLPLCRHAVAPHMSITDFDRKIVYARLGSRLRVAGMADIGGRQIDRDARRVATLQREAQAVFPEAGDFSRSTVWGGGRPATPKGVPIIGATPYPNLWLSVGQGALGFTLALGSGRLLADLLARRKPAVPLAGFSIADH